MVLRVEVVEVVLEDDTEINGFLKYGYDVTLMRSLV
jgi:hypothetical protein